MANSSSDDDDRGKGQASPQVSRTRSVMEGRNSMFEERVAGCCQYKSEGQNEQIAGYDERVEIHWSFVLDALVDNRRIFITQCVA